MLNLKKKLFLGEELTEKEKSFNFSKFHILPIPLEKTVSYASRLTLPRHLATILREVKV